MDAYANEQERERQQMELREAFQQLAIVAEEKQEAAESMKLQNEKLAAEKDACNREREEYKEQVQRLQESLVEALGPGRRRAHTPLGYSRSTTSDPEVFIRRQDGARVGDAVPAADGTTTEERISREPRRLLEGASRPEGHKEEQRRELQSGPWTLRRERRVFGEEDFQRKLDQSQARQREISPENFSGDVPLREYLSQFEACAAWNAWSPHQMTQRLFLCLRGRARGVIRPNEYWQALSYDELVERLEQTFCPKGQSELYLAQLRGRQQQAQESQQDFSQAVIRLTDRAYEGMPEQSKDRIARDHFMANIREREIRSAVHLSRPSTMDEALRTALETEAFLAAEKQRNPGPVKYTRVLGSEEASGNAHMKDLVEKVERLIARENSRQDSTPGPAGGQQQQGWRQNPRQGGTNKGSRTCYRCGKEGHFVADCRVPDTRPCYLCQQTGHRVAECPVLKEVRSQLQSGNEQRPTQGTGEGSNNN